MIPWKWVGELDDSEKEEFRRVLAANPQLRGKKLAWDGESILGYIRAPSQLWYLLEEDGSIGPLLQQAIDSREIIDTKDGGFLSLVTLATKDNAAKTVLDKIEQPKRDSSCVTDS